MTVKVSYLEFNGRSGRMLYVYFNAEGREIAVRTVVQDNSEQTVCAAVQRCAEVAKGVPA
jgi:hypothetical protein